jgi:diguanylate cyclase (GGDEF)-like protein
MLISFMVIMVAALTVNYFQKRLSGLASTDKLTGAGNRRQLDKSFMKYRSRFERNDIPFSIVIFDVDHFKEINDRLGHITGDSVLVGIAAIVKENIRITDSLFRWGGDEFIIIAEGDNATVEVVVERIRNEVNRWNVFPENLKDGRRKITVGISCGIVQYSPGSTLDSMLADADSAMYEAKTGGRNRVIVHG